MITIFNGRHTYSNGSNFQARLYAQVYFGMDMDRNSPHAKRMQVAKAWVTATVIGLVAIAALAASSQSEALQAYGHYHPLGETGTPPWATRTEAPQQLGEGLQPSTPEGGSSAWREAGRRMARTMLTRSTEWWMLGRNRGGGGLNGTWWCEEDKGQRSVHKGRNDLGLMPGMRLPAKRANFSTARGWDLPGQHPCPLHFLASTPNGGFGEEPSWG